MTLAEIETALLAKGYRMCSISRVLEGWMASTRPVKGEKVEDGESGFGRTPQLAVDQLLGLVGAKPKSEPFAALEKALQDLTEALR